MRKYGISYKLLVGHSSLRVFIGGAQCSSWGRIEGLWRLLRSPWHGVDLRHCSQSTGFRAEGWSPPSKMQHLHILCKGIHLLGGAQSASARHPITQDVPVASHASLLHRGQLITNIVALDNYRIRYSNRLGNCIGCFQPL